MEHLSGEKCSKAGLCELSRSEQLAALEMQLRLLKVKKKQPEGEGYIFFAASPSGYVTYGRFFGARMARFAVDLRHFGAHFAANHARPLLLTGNADAIFGSCFKYTPLLDNSMQRREWPLTIDSMTSPSLMPASEAAPPASRPWLALALMFLFLGIGYALPFQLAPAPPVGLWQGSIAPEVLNLYALTVFAGWGHFVYAWRGQFQGTMRLPGHLRAGYWAAVAGCISLLVLLRSLLGVALFSGLVWVWFIAHFVKAELVFAGPSVKGASGNDPSVSWQPVAAFAWLSLVLFDVASIQEHHWLLFGGCTLLGVLILLTGGWRRLAEGSSFLPALALFFDGEAFVWGTYGPYMHPMFRIGVYVFHVAGASFFHYLGSYAYGHARSKRDRWLRPVQVAALNLAIIAICCAAVWLPGLHALTPVLGLEWFTLWVAAHLAASDLLPVWKKLARPTSVPASAGR